jgi:Co/Zn/Cd efflux system component
MVLAGILLVPGFATLWTAWDKLLLPLPPAPVPLTLAGGGALAVNLTCAVILTRYRRHAGSLTRAAFLSARNDAFANIAIIAAGLVTAATLSVWPDLVVGLAIAAINADAAREVYVAARQERRDAVEDMAAP